MIEQLIEIMARLRDPEKGCPWDRQQSFQTIVPHTLEEAYEVAEAIERGRMNEVRDELGDLLFQVVFYAQLAKEAGDFEFRDVVEGIAEKLVRRHPHVFGDARIADAEAQSVAWELHKEKERKKKGQREGLLDSVPRALPALTRAYKLQKRATRVGFDWNAIEPVIAHVEKELDEVRKALAENRRERIEDEVGDLLFTCVNLARFAQVDPETALRQTNAKFERRFRFIENTLVMQGRSLEEATLQELDELWEQAKLEEKP